MDKAQILEIVPHYIAMLVLVYLVLAIVGRTVGDLGFWVEMVLIIVVVFSYRPIVARLGYAPSAWEHQ